MHRVIIVSLVLLLAVPIQAQDCFRDAIGLDPVPITRSAAQLEAGLLAAAAITPRALNGTPASNGKVVFLGVGMSNTANVWNGFRTVLNQSGTAPSSLKWVDATQGGAGAPQWADPTCTCWTDLDAKLVKQKVSAAQVQAVFLMLTTPYPWQSPAANAVRYAQEVEAILVALEDRLPNLQIVYLAGNYYGGYDTNQDKTPEPHDYWENRELQEIQDTHNGSAWVSAATTMLWTDGATPRAWDGLFLLCSDTTSGGVHLSSAGKTTFGGWLYDSLMSDPTTLGWMR